MNCLRRLVCLLLLACGVPASAHQAPSGWEYDRECCHHHDCAPIAPPQIGPDGIRIVLPSGRHGMITIQRVDETIPHGDARIRASGDRQWHACIVHNRVRCVYRPPMGF